MKKRNMHVEANPALSYKRIVRCRSCEIENEYTVDAMFIDIKDKLHPEIVSVFVECECGKDIVVPSVPEYVVDHLKSIV